MLYRLSYMLDLCLCIIQKMRDGFKDTKRRELLKEFQKMFRRIPKIFCSDSTRLFWALFISVTLAFLVAVLTTTFLAFVRRHFMTLTLFS
ncbi:MAG: hypothetical protein HY22_03140 [[Candidatus Thermochlorobacteriaceae] bacterium GBChlB]|nr:MAG: hypothetical protein HY22_03140 [[Candidatus Thermochlorobacteriaceae] bacterium GBChlB]